MSVAQPYSFAAAITLSLLFVACVYILQSYSDSSNSQDTTDPSKIYRNLELRVDASQDEIRLLYLHPGKWNDELVCTLKAVELGNNPHYVALSYAWHEKQPSADAIKKSTFGYVNIYSWWTLLMPKGTRKRLIKVNNGNLGIGTNLELALRHMRSAPGGPTIAVFADAICINQRDLHDRSSQVTLLREIYRKAARVEVWLGAEKVFGPVSASQAASMASSSNLSLGSTFTAQTTMRSTRRHDDDSDTGSSSDGHQPSNFELEFATYQNEHARVSACVDDWYQYYSRPKLFRTDPPPNYTLGFVCMIWLLANDAFKNCDAAKRSRLTKRVPFLADPTRRVTIEVFSEIMNRTWWSRLWVLQEMTIASDLVVRYGRFVIPWDLLSRASKNLLHHMHSTCCSEEFQKLGRSDLETLRTFAHEIAVLDRWRARWNRDAESSAPRISLLRLMRKFGDRGTSNPRDKVYALLPLVNYWGRPKVNGQMAANYDLSVSDVYKKVTKSLLSMEESLDPLIGIRRTGHASSSMLPSWVPDWSMTTNADAMVERARLYKASRDIPLQFRTFGKNKYLELHGVNHDTVVLVGDIMPFDAHFPSHASSRAQTAFQNWKHLARLADEGAQNYHQCIHSSATGRPESKLLAFVRTMCMDSIYLDREDDGYDLEVSSQCYERASPAFKDHVDGWNDPLRDNSVTDDESDGGLIRALPFTHNLIPPGTEDAEDLLRPLEHSTVPGQREAYSMDRAVETATASRRFFVTRKGYFGLGPPQTRRGDSVFVLFGGPVPFVLRDAGKRHIPGLDVKQEQPHSIQAGKAVEAKERENTQESVVGDGIWHESGSMPGDFDDLAQVQDANGVEEVHSQSGRGRSRANSFDYFSGPTFSPDGSLIDELATRRPGTSLQVHRTAHGTFAQTLGQCYELVGDCFVHGIMDGEATVRRIDGKEEAVQSESVYLV